MRNLQGLPSGCSAGCSTLSWSTQDHKHIWGRNFDYNTLALDSKVVYIPRGTVYQPCIDGSGALPRQSAPQMSAYASVGMGTLGLADCPILYEGVNDQGLMGGQLYYRQFAHFPSETAPHTLPVQPPLALYHLLSQCRSVEEVVHALEEELTLVALPLFGTVPPLHWSFCDKTGESIVVESDRDGLHIYRNTVGVMTNSPGYPWHETNLLNYTGIQDLDRQGPELEGFRLEPCFSGSGAQGLPGDWSSPSRFVRLAFLRKYALRGRTEEEGVARLFRLLQSAAFPLGIVRLEQAAPSPADASHYDCTLYTCVMCAESLRFYWTTYENQQIRWVDLSALSQGSTPLEFPLEQGPQFLCAQDTGRPPASDAL